MQRLPSGRVAGTSPQRGAPGAGAAFLTAAYLITSALLIAVLGRSIPHWRWLVMAHAIGAGTLLLARLRRTPLSGASGLLLDWHPLVLFPLLYREVAFMAPAMGDWRLTATIPVIEAALFRGQPSVYLSVHLPYVALSEFLHACYLAYVVVIPAVAAYWYVEGRRAAFHDLMLLLSGVMYGSYLLFILFPVDSPYYRLERLGPPLANHFFFDLVHYVSSRGGARGGAFPSAHVSGAVVLWLVASRHQTRLAWVLAPLVLGLIAATVYGRFHYAVDSVAGLGVAVIAVAVHTRSRPRRAHSGTHA